MLAEKFILVLEARIRNARYLDRNHEGRLALNPEELPMDPAGGEFPARRGASARNASTPAHSDQAPPSAPSFPAG
jgi:hypothetical protein